MTKLKVLVNGNYIWGERTVSGMTIEGIEAKVSSLQPEENTCISNDGTRVYNSSMAPLYSNGQVCIAHNWSGKICRDYEVIGKDVLK